MSDLALSHNIPDDARPIVSAMLTRLAALPGFVKFNLHYEDDFEVAATATTPQGIADELGACDMETIVVVLIDPDTGKRRAPCVVLIYSNGRDVISDHAIGPAAFTAAIDEVTA